MTHRSRLSLGLVLGMALSFLTLSPGPAAAATYHYAGTAGGSRVFALGATISSGLTGRSSVNGHTLPAYDSNKVLGVHAGGVVDLGTVSTWAQATKADGGVKTLTGGRTADISLLGGVIRADAVETNTSAVLSPDGVKSHSHTDFVNLHIGSKSFPLTVDQNTNIRVPGVANITLNGRVTTKTAHGIITQGFGLMAVLLKPIGDAPAGAVVVLNPTFSSVFPSAPPGALNIHGVAYGSYLDASAADGDLTVSAGPTAHLAMPPGGTGGQTLENTTASVYVRHVLTIHGIRSTAYGYTYPGPKASTTMTNETASVNLLSGLVTADALKVVSHTWKFGDDPLHTKAKFVFTDLVVAGHHISVDVGRNTQIKVADVGTVTINKFEKGPIGNTIVGVEVKLSTEQYGVPAGTILQLAVASSYISQSG